MVQLQSHMKPWKKYVDDTVTWNKEELIPNVINTLNNFHDNMKLHIK